MLCCGSLSRPRTIPPHLFCWVLTKNFQAGKIYNLGTLTAPVAQKIMGINGDWTTGVAMFEASNGFVVAKNVKFDGNDAIKVVYTKDTTTNYINALPGDYYPTMDSDNDGNLKPANGTYDIYFKDDVIFFCEPGTSKYESKWGVVGHNNNWNVGDPTRLYHDILSDTYVGTITFTDGKEFKLSQNGATNWNGCVTGDSNISNNSLKAGTKWENLWWNNAGANFVLPKTGTWNFEISFSANPTYIVVTE